ncbi:MAG: sugar ABC transporter permease [Treponema sp.]|nr:sugar ABC transporter permease [Treponema sp.]
MAERLKKADKKVLGVLIVPGISVFCFALLIPIAIAVYYSLFTWRSITKPVWNGFANFRELATDPIFWKALINNLKLAFYTLVGQIGIGYFLAFALVSRWVRFRQFHRIVMYFPAMVSSVVMSFLWTLVYSNDYGILNALLRLTGLGKYTTAWLSNPKIVVEVLAVPLIWQWFGYYTVIFLSAFVSIPSEVLESAKLEGAVGIKLAWRIYMPMTYDTLKVAVMLCLAGIMKAFDHVLVMTDGGPGTSSMVLALYAYKTTFVGLRHGFGSSIAVGIVIISLVITMLARTIMGGKRYD